ncbi:hypothetical protein EYR97_19815 [Alteromonas sp. KUL42]|nr:hypothetical protein [Alteromonas sp. KUL42]TAP31763.1 hypothetical protein EYR97_19815 [Alteromonas sp. KUL42]
MTVALNTFTPEMNNILACKLGEIQRHLVEDTELVVELSELGIDLDKEIDGYECLITALYELQKHVDQNI